VSLCNPYIEDELLVGPLHSGGVAACGALDVGVLYLEVVGAGAAPRVDGANYREDHDDVQPTKLLFLLHGC
jgi:hypothetical protein